ncbi:ABC transporter substrate-binding protein [Rhizobium sp. AU243]|uniref:ABC transporter substrate-binding protein n=1 Tax=Rhizobium sp. AU243 TaxID=2303425 RepID=UPI0010CC7B19|nr:ABC transporter substrate-binding protein [Rhizobium sp. AU243]TKV70780.1 ABC transporter substrate-binding protein [Rhizobium sp. AU243]
MHSINRRTFLAGAAGAGSLALATSWPKALMAQEGPIKIGMIIPLTGATSQFGAAMSAAAKVAVNDVNAAGGINGRKIEVLIEDDQSNPEAAVRAARKLIDVDKVVAIGGSYASAVTSAIAPLCYESKTVLFTSSGADSITKTPHQGYIFRTSPTVTLQGTRVGQYALGIGAKNMFFLGPQTPFAQSYIDIISSLFKKAGGTGAGLIYEDKRASYRTEVDQALRANPDVIVLGGYVPDTSVVLKDLYRAGYTGNKVGFSFGVNQVLADGLPPEVSEGTTSLIPSASVDSTAYKTLIDKMQLASLDGYSCQMYDHVILTTLALAHAAAASADGTVARDNVRAISQDDAGEKVTDVAAALKLIAEKKAVNYDGPSGPLEFNSIGDVEGVFFRYEQAQKGKMTLLKVA